MPSILIVDDEDKVREFLRTCLERCGHAVREASNGEMALLALADSPVDLVVTDLVMPRMGGIALIQSVRRDFPSVKLIALSAFPDELTDARRIGADWVEAKPFSPRRLCNAIDRLLQAA